MKRPGLFYNVALALVAVGYVVLLVVLLNDKPDSPRTGRIDAERARQLVRAPAINSAYQQGLKATGTPDSSCELRPPDAWRCGVSGFFNASGAPCSVAMRVDASRRRPLIAPAGVSCGPAASR